MSYTAEAIRNLPASMQQEVANLNSQITSLEKKRAELQLPLDVVISRDTVIQKKTEAKEIEAAARHTASTILSKAQLEAQRFKLSEEVKLDILNAELKKRLQEVEVKEQDNRTWAEALKQVSINATAREVNLKDAELRLKLREDAFKAKIVEIISVLGQV